MRDYINYTMLSVLFVTSASVCAQEQKLDYNNWLMMENEKIEEVEITKSDKFKIENYTFHVIWDDKLTYDKTIRF